MQKNSSMIKCLGLAVILGTSFMSWGHATTFASTPSSSLTQPHMSKVDILIKAAELERQAAAKQATDVNAAHLLREQAKHMREQANTMSDSSDKGK